LIWLGAAGLALVFGLASNLLKTSGPSVWTGWIAVVLGGVACLGAVGYVQLVTRRAARTESMMAHRARDLVHLNEQLSQDLRERKSIEASLRESEQRFRSVMESANDAIVLADAAGKIISWNKGAQNIFGYSESEMLQQNIRQLMPQRFHDNGLPSFRLAGEGAVIGHTVELMGLRKDGTEFPLELSLSVWQQDQRTFFSSFMRDITPRKEAEAALRVAEARYRDMFVNAIEGIFQSTPDGRYLAVNPALARMYGYNSPGELMASVSNIGEQVYADSTVREQFRQQIEEFGEVRGLEYQVRRRDGVLIWISEFARVVRDPGGAVLHYEGTIKDISRRKQVEEENNLLEAQMRQSKKMEAIGTLAGGIAHDFNNILGAIVGFTEMSLEDLPPRTLTRSNLEHVLKAAHRARDLVRQILAFSRQSNSERHDVQLGGLVRETLKLIRATLPATVEISHQFNSQADTIIADPTQIQQVLMNLCTNAGHAMRERGGKLHLALDDAGDPVASSRHGTAPVHPGFIKLTVSDTGHGMTREIADRIFEPFFTTKGVGEGTGLGLAVVHGIVTSHDGSISVVSAPGKGTTFTVLLPRAKHSSPAIGTPAQMVALGRGRILFVDDEEDLVNVAQQRLRRLGYKVTTKSDSLEALNTFRNNPGGFDLVITDVTMPHMTGMKLGRELRRIRGDIPVILCTGSTLAIDPGEMEASGFAALLMKPLDFNHLSKLLRKTLDGVGPPAAAGKTDYGKNTDN
jgi:PAS domain S-box-containing protein